jgi:hypothetical protein
MVLQAKNRLSALIDGIKREGRPFLIIDRGSRRTRLEPVTTGCEEDEQDGRLSRLIREGRWCARCSQISRRGSKMSNAIICPRWLWPRCSQWWPPLSEVDGLQATTCVRRQAALLRCSATTMLHRRSGGSLGDACGIPAP